MSILIYTPKITPRFRYVFRQIFVRILEIPVSFTASLDTFVAFSGPKFSYAPDQLGQEFHVYACPFLEEQGIQDQNIVVGHWQDLPVIFTHDKPSQIPFDLFAASFYCLSRYEEHLPHLQDTLGRFEPSQSWVVQGSCLDAPLVDQWAQAFYQALQSAFPDLPDLKSNQKVQKHILFDIVHPLKYRFKPTISKFIQGFRAFLQFNLWDVIEQILVELGLSKDPYDTYDDLIAKVKNRKSITFFFSMAQKSYDNSAVNIYNNAFQSLVKGVSDDLTTSLLVSHHTQLDFNNFNSERQNLEKLIHRPIHSIRLHRGLIRMATTYPKLIRQEITKDFSMGYPHTIGYRASTAVPFYFYDLQNEYQTPLLIHPVVASESALRKYTSQQAFAYLERLYKVLPTVTAVFYVSFTNAIWQKESNNKTWRKHFFKYLEADAAKG